MLAYHIRCAVVAAIWLYSFSVLYTVSMVGATVSVLECVHSADDCGFGSNDSCVLACTQEESLDPPAHCYALWKNTSKGIEVLKQGCWHTPREECRPNQCVSAPGEKPDRLFCCCSGDRCNREVFFNPVVLTTTQATATVEATTGASNQHTLNALLYTILPLVGLALLVSILFWLYRRHKLQYQMALPTHDPCPPSPVHQTELLQNLQLIEVKARGRYGAVWKALLGEAYVAVKAFPLQDKASWFREQEIYNMPHMQHPNVLAFIGTDRRGANLQTELWLITTYLEKGSLCDHLKSNLITWAELCHIARTMACGLAYLHEEQSATRDAAYKPSIAHRDFKSKNVLLKDDLTACMADFGLALPFERNKSPGDIHCQVGTRRYMAPEVLEGAINFQRDAFLKIDMYACGLVLWELVSRCSSSDGPVGDYKLPFEEDIGLHPTLEDMQDVVVHKKLRPQTHDHWLHHPGLERVINTLEECWDQDAEARLSASCVEERFALLQQNISSSSAASNQDLSSIVADGNAVPLIAAAVVAPDDVQMQTIV